MRWRRTRRRHTDNALLAQAWEGAGEVVQSPRRCR